MSTLLGAPSDRWPLSRALEALGQSARSAGVPGAIWMAGIFYPSLNVSYDLLLGVLSIVHSTTGIPMPATGNASELFFAFGPQVLWSSSATGMIWMALAVLPLLFLLCRLIVGLARICDPGLWADRADGGTRAFVAATIGRSDTAETFTREGQSPGLGAAWRAGRGLGRVGFGMWMLLVALLMGVTLIFLMPLVTVVHLFDLQTLSPLLAGLILPILAVILAYAIVLQVINQLALHSLAHNRRGVASALTHAWRLVRGSPWGTFRATLADLVLFALVLALQGVLHSTLAGLPSLVLICCLHGFAGVTRAGYWARTYRALGGLSVADHVPGLTA